eukprot:6173748-Pleurochrysis_carterae.AAC.1
MVVEYPLVFTICAGPSLLPRIGCRMCPSVVRTSRFDPLEAATRLVSAFWSSKGDRSTAHTSPTSKMSRVTLKTAPWGRKDLCERMLTRSNTSSMSMASRMFSSARASR